MSECVCVCVWGEWEGGGGGHERGETLKGIFNRTTGRGGGWGGGLSGNKWMF